jgi:hypothetical protein
MLGKGTMTPPDQLPAIIDPAILPAPAETYLVPIHKRILFSGVARRAVVGLRRVPVHFRVVIAAQGERIV